MEPRFLRQLADVVDLGSLSLAAKSLNISQPTLSRNIKSLEAWIKAPVVQRNRYGITPTAVGELLAKDGRVIRDVMRQVEVTLANWQGNLKGGLNIGAGAMLAHSIVPTFLSEVSVEGWNVALRIEVQSADRLLDRVRSGILDLAIVEFGAVLPRDGLVEVALLEDPRAFFVGESHRLAASRSVALEQLRTCSHITVGSFLEEHFAPACQAIANTRRGPAIELSGDIAIALHLLSTGRFVAMLPVFIMSNLCDTRVFRQLPYKGRMPTKRLSIWHRSELSGHPLVMEFVRRFRRFAMRLQKNGPDAIPVTASKQKQTKAK